MSQKEKNFQSKPRRGGQKFGGFKPKDRSRGPREERGFGNKSEGDRGDRPARSFDRRPHERDDRPPRRDRDGRSENKGGFSAHDSRPPRRERDFGDKKPYQKREYAGRDENRRDFGDKKPYQKREYAGRDENRRDTKDKKPYAKERRPFDKFDSRPQKSHKRYGEDQRDYKPKRRPDLQAERERPVEREFNRDEARQKLKSDRPSYGAPSSAFLYGVHAVSQALLNPKRIHQRLLATEKGRAALEEAWNIALDKGIALPQVTIVEKEDIERLLPRDAVHQDMLLDSQPLEEMFLPDLLLNAPDDAKILVLDQVTDPHNIGAILRSAAAFGALAVVIQKIHAPEITGTLAKSASGAVEHVPLVREVNLSRAMEQLKEAGFFCIGLAEEGKRTLAEMNLNGGKAALVLGAEGAGLRRLVAENCDELVKLPTQAPIGSLNVSNAAAVALYELIRK